MEGGAKDETAKYAYWLACMKGCTRRVQARLFSICADAKEVYSLSGQQLEKIPGLMHKDIARIIESKKTWDIESEWENLARKEISFTSLEQENYPMQLRELADAPYGLFYRGRLPAPDEFRVAIVGARMCSEYGRGIAKELAKELAMHDVPVFSGMAKGIDAAGHRGALDSGGDTYAVFGCGVDICYPSYHRQLYEDIICHGGVLTEYPPGVPPLAAHFPQRNRIISALSDVVFIIEAKEKSGSLITADFALEQGRDVYALPGRITDALSRGCNRLIAQGAGTILSVDDCIAELSIEAVRKKNSARDIREKGRKKAGDNIMDIVSDKNFMDLHKFSLEKDERLVYGCLGILPTGFEEILEKTGFDVQTASQAIAALQQKRHIEEIYKNHYKIITE